MATAFFLTAGLVRQLLSICIEFSIKKTIVKDNLEEGKGQMMLEEYKTFAVSLMPEMSLEEYKVFSDSLMLEMTPKEYKAFLNSLTPEQHKTFIDNPLLKMSSEKHKILLVETLARTLSSERYHALLVETLAHTLSQEEYRHFIDNLPPERREAITRRVVVGKMIEVLADTFVLLGRVRKGSNLIHGVLKDGFEKLGDDPSKTFENIGRQLERVSEALESMPGIVTDIGQMNQKMSSVPAMAAQMDLMNRNIASMTASTGSTMGRMGKWMPW